MDDSDGEVDVGVGSGGAGDKGVVLPGGMCAWQVGARVSGFFLSGKRLCMELHVSGASALII